MPGTYATSTIESQDSTLVPESELRGESSNLYPGLESLQSDFETSNLGTEDKFQRDYFLGKKFFEYVLAESLTTQPNASSDRLEAKLASAVSSFPYGDGMRKLRALRPMPESPTGENDIQATLWVNIGTLARRGDDGFKREMAVAIRDCLRHAPNDKHPQELPPKGQAQWRPSDSRHRRSLFSDDAPDVEPFTPPRQDLELARTGQPSHERPDYISKLHLYDQSQQSSNCRSNYDFRMLDNGDHIAQVKTPYVDRVFQGTAKKKMDAKQDAAEKACAWLGL